VSGHLEAGDHEQFPDTGVKLFIRQFLIPARPGNVDVLREHTGDDSDKGRSVVLPHHGYNGGAVFFAVLQQRRK
jgi:hypothetical protein